MAKEQPASIAAHFGNVTDPRLERTRDHRLLDMLTPPQTPLEQYEATDLDAMALRR